MRRDSIGVWIITADHIFNPQYDKQSCVGRRSLAFKPEHDARCTVKFKLYDDDGEFYYEGKMTPEMLKDEELAFEPLDWAAGFAGATTMRVLQNGKWEVL